MNDLNSNEKVSAISSCHPNKNDKKNSKSKDDETPKCGKPISMVNGEEILVKTDFLLPGPLLLIWRRSYHSSLAGNYGLGHGWTCIITECLHISTNKVIYQNAEGRLIHFECPKIDETVWNTDEKFTLIREKDQVYRLKSHGKPDKYFNIPKGKGELLLGEIRDKLDNRLTFYYAGRGKLQDIVSNWGRSLKLTYNGKGQVTAVYHYLTGNEVNSPALVHYSYDSQGDLIKVTDRAGHSEQYQYQNHVIIKITNKIGYSVYFKWDRYDTKARCLKQWGDNDTNEYSFEWQPDQRISKFIDSNGVRIFRHDAQGKLINKTDPDGEITSFQYDEQGNLTDYVDQNGNRETNTYDAQGLLTSTTNVLGNIYKIKYNPAGLPKLLTDPLGNEWIQEYNEQDLLVKVTDPEGNTTIFQYNSKGLPILITNALGYQHQLQWNDLGNLITETNSEGRTIHYKYDAEGNITEIITPDGKKTHYQYNALGQITCIIYPDGKQTRIAYNRLGLMTHYTDIVGRTTEYQYNDLSQVKRRIDRTGHVFEYLYDTQGNLITLRNEKGEHYHFKYGKNLRLVEEIGFDGRIQKYEFDRAGHLNRHLDGNRITEFKRDALGHTLEKNRTKMTSEQEETTESNYYSYNVLGHLTEASNEHRTVKFEYDAFGNLIREHQDDAVIQHKYDVLGNLIRTILPSGQILDYCHDKEGLYNNIQLNGEILTKLTRDSIGRETSRTQGKLSSHFEYDPMGRLKKHYVSDHMMPLIQREYNYDKAGNLNFIKDLEKGQTHIEYDVLNRLRRFNNEEFTFDPVSNIIINEGKQASYSQGGRLQMQGDRHFEYDDAGNLIRERRGKDGLVIEYCYNTENQLIQVIKQGQVISYKYDALGRRISKQDAFGETTFLWNGDVLLSETCNHIHKTYIYEPYSFKPLAFVQDGEVYYYHLDHLGTPQEMTDAQGEIVWSVRYKAYGNVICKEVEQVENNLRFQGQYFDEETGLHYNRFRYYDPDVGRFIHQDPIGLLGGDNLYLYVYNPVMFVDPFGLATLHYWSMKDIYIGEGDEREEFSAKGHISLTLDDGTYITYWPSTTNVVWTPPDLRNDLQWEIQEEKFYPNEIQITGLNEKK